MNDVNERISKQLSADGVEASPTNVDIIATLIQLRGQDSAETVADAIRFCTERKLFV